MERVGMLYLPWRAHTITFLKTRVTHTHTTKHTHLSFLKTFQDILPNFVNKSNAKPKVTVVFVTLPF